MVTPDGGAYEGKVRANRQLVCPAYASGWLFVGRQEAAVRYGCSVAQCAISLMAEAPEDWPAENPDYVLGEVADPDLVSAQLDCPDMEANLLPRERQALREHRDRHAQIAAQILAEATGRPQSLDNGS